MKFLNMKLAGALLASIAMACSGSVWSASTPRKHVKSVFKHIYKHPLQARGGRSVAAASPAVPMAIPTEAGMMAAVLAVPAVIATTNGVVQTSYASAGSVGNPYLAYQQQSTASTETPPEGGSWGDFSLKQLVDGVKNVLPSIPDGQSILPSIKRVYPTGEKPLVVLTFHCPTELIGITPIPIKALHGLVNLGFDALNATNLLSFNMQQVCQ